MRRSATAPEISAGVMTANISWNMQNASTGMASGPGQATARAGVRVGRNREAGELADGVREADEIEVAEQACAFASLPKAKLKP